MKKFLAIIFAATLLAQHDAIAQSGVVRGEISAGSYENIKSTSQSLNVNLGGTPTAAALADATANPTTNTFGTDNFLFNGATWDRWRSSTNGTGIALVSTSGRDPCMSSDVAKVSAIINISTAATTSLVSPSASTVVYVCAFTMTISQVVTTANTIKFVRGTGATCGTGTADLTGAFGAGGVTAAPPLTVATGTGHTLFKTAAADGLCATTTIGGSASFVGVLTYVQQ